MVGVVPLLFILPNFFCMNLGVTVTYCGVDHGSEVKVSACNAGDLSSIPGSGRSAGEGNGNPLQCSCLENPMDGGAWWATVLLLLLLISRFSRVRRCATPVGSPPGSTVLGFSRQEHWSGLPFPCPRGRKASDTTEQLHFHCDVEGFVWLFLFIFNVGTPLCRL